MEVKFKKLSDKAVLPSRAYEGDAGLDLVATRVQSEVNECGQFILVYHTDLAMELPKGYVALLFPRSSIAKKSLVQTNCVGVIDSGYRGEIMVKYRNTSGDAIPAVYNIGDKIAQLIIMPIPAVDIVESDELSETERGAGGYGSSDNTEEKDTETTDVTVNSEDNQ